MKIEILKCCLALVDGFRLERFNKGEIYEVRESVGCYLIDRKKAKLKLEK